MATRREVFTAINSERDYQDMRKKRDGGSEFHSIEEFMFYTEFYLSEVRRIASTTWGPDAAPKTLEFVRKVVALGVACMEQHGAPQRAGFERDASELSMRIVLDLNHAMEQLEENPGLGEKLSSLVNPTATALLKANDERIKELEDALRRINDRDVPGWEARQIAREALDGVEGELVDYASGPAEQPPTPEPYIQYVAPQPDVEIYDDEIPF